MRSRYCRQRQSRGPGECCTHARSVDGEEVQEQERKDGAVFLDLTLYQTLGLVVALRRSFTKDSTEY